MNGEAAFRASLTPTIGTAWSARCKPTAVKAAVMGAGEPTRDEQLALHQVFTWH